MRRMFMYFSSIAYIYMTSVKQGGQAKFAVLRDSVTIAANA